MSAIALPVAVAVAVAVAGPPWLLCDLIVECGQSEDKLSTSFDFLDALVRLSCGDLEVTVDDRVRGNCRLDIASNLAEAIEHLACAVKHGAGAFGSQQGAIRAVRSSECVSS